jgi:hypothetical protein
MPPKKAKKAGGSGKAKDSSEPTFGGSELLVLAQTRNATLEKEL